MTSMVMAAWMWTAGAQAQDLEGNYDVECALNEIQIFVRVAHTKLPDGALYVDGFVLPLDCSGVATQEQLDQLHDDLLAACQATSPGADACVKVAADLREVVSRQPGLQPVDDITVANAVADDKGFVLVDMLLDLEEKADDVPFRARVREDGSFRTNRRVRRVAEVADLEMDCSLRAMTGAAGDLDPLQNAAQIDYRRHFDYDCLYTGSDPVFDRDVTFDINLVSVAETPQE